LLSSPRIIPLFNKYINLNINSTSEPLVISNYPSTLRTKWHSSEVLIWKVTHWKLFKMKPFELNVNYWKSECYAFYHKWFIQNMALSNHLYFHFIDLFIKFWHEILNRWQKRPNPSKYCNYPFADFVLIPNVLYAKFADLQGYNSLHDLHNFKSPRAHFKYFDSSDYHFVFHLINFFHSDNILYARFAEIQGYSFQFEIYIFTHSTSYFKYSGINSN
jgi:hypothetical protein